MKSYWLALGMEQISSEPGFKVRLGVLGLGTLLSPVRCWGSLGFSEVPPAL